MTHDHDHLPDEQLGKLLRESLEPYWHGAFVGRVSAAVRADAGSSRWSVLAAWLRPGLVAAAGIAAMTALGFALLQAPVDPATFADVVVAEGVPAAMLAGDPGPSDDMLLSAVMEGR